MNVSYIFSKFSATPFNGRYKRHVYISFMVFSFLSLLDIFTLAHAPRLEIVITTRIKQLLRRHLSTNFICLRSTSLQITLHCNCCVLCSIYIPAEYVRFNKHDELMKPRKYVRAPRNILKLYANVHRLVSSIIVVCHSRQ